MNQASTLPATPAGLPSSGTTAPAYRYLLTAQDHADTRRMGGKAAALARLNQAHLPIPEWFVLTPEALFDSLTPTQQQALRHADAPAVVLALLAEVMPSDAVLAEVHGALAGWDPEVRVAVRSSAIDEDGAQHSFAGQMDSFLFVSPADVAEKIAAVWRSGYAERILTYRRENQLDLLPGIPAVLVQRMVDADSAGVAFGADPVSGRRGVAVVGAVYGLGTALVGGELDADTWQVDRAGSIIGRALVAKPMAHRMDPQAHEGVSAQPVPAEQVDQPALSDAQVLQVAELVRATSRHFERPQDIEWALQDGQLYLLQSRPITSLARLADPDGAKVLWDNSNIVESFGGVTTPLTFSFARYAYENIYRKFVQIMGVPESVASDHANVFANMLGLVRGRVYYNLLCWYQALALLPGFASNRRFMEQMMGVKEGLPEEIARALEKTGFAARFKDRMRLIRTLFGFVSNHFVIERKVEAFYQRLAVALQPTQPPLDQMRPDELVAHYRGLERQLLTRWDAPLINDFFCMMFFGVLRKLTAAWCGDRDGTLQNDLMCDQGGMISAEPAKRLVQMAEQAAQKPELVEILRHGDLAAILAGMEQAPALQRQYADYLEVFGDRCLDELKLESNTLHDDPLLLLRSVGQYADRLIRLGDAARVNVEAQLRAQAEQRVREALRGAWWRRWVFGWVLKHARARIVGRENLRFERTRLFGRVRRVFLELGRQLHAVGVLDQPRDVFYLEVHEILGFVEGSASAVNLRGLAAVRQADYQRFRSEPAPDDRFETRGMVNQGQSYRGELAPVVVEGQEVLHGLGCCPGVVRGPVRVVHDPQGAVLHSGEILVAERTDPGWIMLFPMASGLLVERGSLLSHSAIVSREMGIPSVVSLHGVLRWLQTGDWVELDGQTGLVRKIAPPEAQPAGDTDAANH